MSPVRSPRTSPMPSARRRPSFFRITVSSLSEQPSTRPSAGSSCMLISLVLWGRAAEILPPPPPTQRLERQCQVQLLADAAAARDPGSKPIPVGEAEAAFTRRQIGNEKAGYFAASVNRAHVLGRGGIGGPHRSDSSLIASAALLSDDRAHRGKGLQAVMSFS